MTSITRSQINEDEVLSQQTAQLYGALRSSLPATVINVAILDIVLWDIVDESSIYIWTCIIILSLVLRTGLSVMYNRASDASSNPSRWLNLFTFGTLTTALSWASANILIYPDSSVVHQVFLAFIIAGVTAGSISTLSFHRVNITLFLSIILIPFGIKMLFVDSPISLPMGIMILVYFVVVFISATRINRYISQNIRLTLESTLREQLIHDNEIKLLESQKKTQLHINQTPLAFLEWNTQFEIVSWNPAAQRIFGYSDVEALGRTVTKLLSFDSETEKHNKLLNNIHSSKTSTVMTLSNQTREGKLITCEWHCTPLIDNDGKVIGTASFVQDVSEKKQQEKNLLEAKEAAEKANAAKSDFLSRMSHELRTPMNAILGFGKLLLVDKHDALSDNQAARVDQINKAGEHLLELINDILDLAKVENSQIELELTAVNLADLINQSISLVKPLTSIKNLELISEINEIDNIYIKADQTRIKQIIINLLSNAIKYNVDNGSVILSCRRLDNNQIEIRVKDTGIGLTESQQAQLFKPFERLGAEDSEIEGTGIGLVISKTLIELMNGSIEFKSTPGKGSSFWIQLPVTDAPENIQLNETHDTTTQEKEIKSGKSECYKVLYVEDDPTNIMIVEQILSYKDDIELSVATDGKTGIEKALSLKPDLLLLDINLPDISGLDIARELRANHDFDNTPIIAFSANAMPADILKGEQAGFDEYQVKPIDLDKFEDMLQRRLYS